MLPRFRASDSRVCEAKKWPGNIYNIALRCVGKVATSGSGLCDLFDRPWGLCYGNFRKLFGALSGGEQRFRYWRSAFTQAN